MLGKTLVIKILLSSILLLVTCTANAGPVETKKKFVLDNTHIIALHSKETGRDHELIVSMPYSYDSKPDKRYPVLYFLDAYWDVPLLSATYGALYYDQLIPEFIMVGLSYPDEHNYGQERQIDFSPRTQDNRQGASEQFYAFLTQQVIPRIDKQYRTIPGERALAGSSLGGLFALTSMYKPVGFFNRYLAISPCIYGYEEYIRNLDHSQKKSNDPYHRKLYVSYGSAEVASFAKPIKDYQLFLDKKNHDWLEYTPVVIEGLRHASVKNEGYAKGLAWLWKDLVPKGPSGLEKELKAVIPWDTKK